MKVDIQPADITLSMSEYNLTRLIEKKNQKTLKKLTKLIHKSIKHGLNYCDLLKRDIGDLGFLKDYLMRLGYTYEDCQIRIPDEWSSHLEDCLRIIWGNVNTSELVPSPEEKLLSQPPRSSPIMPKFGFVVDE